MQNGRCRLRFATEAFAGGSADSQLWGQDFDCDKTLEFRLKSLQDNAKSSLADDFKNLNIAELADRFRRGRGLQALDCEVGGGVSVERNLRPG